jgi:hypothetical protein
MACHFAPATYLVVLGRGSQTVIRYWQVWMCQESGYCYTYIFLWLFGRAPEFFLMFTTLYAFGFFCDCQKQWG